MYLCGYVTLWRCNYVATWLYGCGYVATWLSGRGYVAKPSTYVPTPTPAPVPLLAYRLYGEYGENSDFGSDGVWRRIILLHGELVTLISTFQKSKNLHFHDFRTQWKCP